mmetsp:Transcript_84738/g.263194  ORF Transcript_84738/g.263194 Transcript_84738/m.263194 type:complete len:500 (+) Transcript_84738:71-1570(+)
MKILRRITPPGRLKRCLRGLFRYWITSSIAYQTFSKYWVYDPRVRCKHPPLGNNQTGIQVLVAALAKSGTRTMMRALYQIGYEHSYHSEDANLFVWSRVIDEYWDQPHMKDKKPMFRPQRYDRQILGEWFNSPQFTDAFSRCRVDAMSFDGLARMFMFVYQVSPGSKVIILNWRTWKEQLRSYRDYNRFQFYAGLVIGFLTSPTGNLPWGYLILNVLEPLNGYPIRTLLEEGGPPINQAVTAITLYYYSSVQRERVSMRIGEKSIGWWPKDEENFHLWYDLVRLQVPAKDRFEFDYRKHGFEDLCKFLEIDPCPKKGRLPKVWNYLPIQMDFPRQYFVWLPVVLLFHWVNWQLLVRLPRACERRCWALAGRVADGPLGAALRRAREKLRAKSHNLGDLLLATSLRLAEAVSRLARTALWLCLLPLRLLLRLVSRAVGCLWAVLRWLVVTPLRIFRWIILAPFRLLFWLVCAPVRLVARLLRCLRRLAVPPEANAKAKVT